MPSAVAKRVWNVTEAVKSLGKDLEGLQWFDREGVLELADAEAKEVRRAVDVSLAKQGRRTTIAVVPSTSVILLIYRLCLHSSSPFLFGSHAGGSSPTPPS